MGSRSPGILLSQDSLDSCQEMPIPMRKRRALRSLSSEPLKKVKLNEPGSGSILPSNLDDDLSPHGPDPMKRLTRSITPHHYQPHPQESSADNASTVQIQGTSSGLTILDYATPVLPHVQESHDRGESEIEVCAGEQEQVSNTTIGVVPTRNAPSESLVEDVEKNVSSSQAERAGSPDKKKRRSIFEMEVEASGSVEKVSSEVTSPHRYGTRRQGRGGENTVEKLTQSYSARIEQALGSPDMKKKPSHPTPPRRTPKAKITPKEPVKPVGRKGRRSRGTASSAKAKSENVEKDQPPEGKDNNDTNEGVHSSEAAAAKPSTSVGMKSEFRTYNV